MGIFSKLTAAAVAGLLLASGTRADEVSLVGSQSIRDAAYPDGLKINPGHNSVVTLGPNVSASTVSFVGTHTNLTISIVDLNATGLVRFWGAITGGDGISVKSCTIGGGLLFSAVLNGVTSVAIEHNVVTHPQGSAISMRYGVRDTPSVSVSHNIATGRHTATAAIGAGIYFPPLHTVAGAVFRNNTATGWSGAGHAYACAFIGIYQQAVDEMEHSTVTIAANTCNAFSNATSSSYAATGIYFSMNWRNTTGTISGNTVAVEAPSAKVRALRTPANYDSTQTWTMNTVDAKGSVVEGLEFRSLLGGAVTFADSTLTCNATSSVNFCAEFTSTVQRMTIAVTKSNFTMVNPSTFTKGVIVFDSSADVEGSSNVTIADCVLSNDAARAGDGISWPSASSTNDIDGGRFAMERNTVLLKSTSSLYGRAIHARLNLKGGAELLVVNNTAGPLHAGATGDQMVAFMKGPLKFTKGSLTVTGNTATHNDEFLDGSPSVDSSATAADAVIKVGCNHEDGVLLTEAALKADFTVPTKSTFTFSNDGCTAATPVPPTPAPATPVPPTPAPATPVPATPVPPVASTPAPATPTPPMATPAPGTAQATPTPAADSDSSSSSAPSSAAPTTPTPFTAAPSPAAGLTAAVAFVAAIVGAAL